MIRSLAYYHPVHGTSCTLPGEASCQSIHWYFGQLSRLHVGFVRHTSERFRATRMPCHLGVLLWSILQYLSALRMLSLWSWRMRILTLRNALNSSGGMRHMLRIILSWQSGTSGNHCSPATSSSWIASVRSLGPKCWRKLLACSMSRCAL